MTWVWRLSYMTQLCCGVRLWQPELSLSTKRKEIWLLNWPDGASLPQPVLGSQYLSLWLSHPSFCGWPDASIFTFEEKATGPCLGHCQSLSSGLAGHVAQLPLSPPYRWGAQLPAASPCPRFCQTPWMAAILGFLLEPMGCLGSLTGCKRNKLKMC